MIVDRILTRYTTRARERRPQSGLPTGSAFGTCAAQLEMLRHPRFSQPEPLTARRLMVLEDGNEREAWFAREIDTDHPARSGLAQQPFYLRVPLEPADLPILREKLRTRDFWGVERAGFIPPRVHVGDDGRVKIRTAADRKMGFVLDPTGPAVWAPTYIDRILYDPTQEPSLALYVLEKKTLSNFGFHRVVVADPGYKMRAQLAGEAEATGLPTVLLAYRKDAAHMAEIVYRQGEERVRVDLLLPSGQRETFFAPRPGGELTHPDGTPVDKLPHGDGWEAAEVWSPFDPELLAAIRARIRRVLLFAPTPEMLRPGAPGWDREYGPDFRCARCGGQGRRVCPTCKGRGTTPKGKVCGVDSKEPGVRTCQGATTVTCGDCMGAGQLAEAPLPVFPCGYCPVRAFCWPMARMEFARADFTARPVFMVSRQDVEAAGLTWVPAEPVPVTPAPVLEEPAEQMSL